MYCGDSSVGRFKKTATLVESLCDMVQNLSSMSLNAERTSRDRVRA